jgi:hypothetical protein
VSAVAKKVYVAEPHVGIGPVKLGMTREEVLAAMEHPPSDSQPGRDRFHRNALLVEYDGGTARVTFVEASRHADFSYGLCVGACAVSGSSRR